MPMKIIVYEIYQNILYCLHLMMHIKIILILSFLIWNMSIFKVIFMLQ